MNVRRGVELVVRPAAFAAAFAMVALGAVTVHAVTFADPADGGMMPVGDMASTPTVARGSVVDITSGEAGLLGDFTAKPKVWATYDDPVTGVTGKKATLKVLNKITADLPVGAANCELTKNIRLYDRKAFIAEQKNGVDAATWLAVPGNQVDWPLDVHMSSKKDGIVDDLAGIGGLTLAAPQILTVTVGDGDVAIEGNWFGTRKPKVWREFENAKGQIKKQNCKVLPADGTYVNDKGKNVYMDPATGASKVNVVIPTKLPKGRLIGNLVLDNQVGMDTVADPTNDN
jgi:hypothetical protein